jgi:hypothetical protein
MLRVGLSLGVWYYAFNPFKLLNEEINDV